MELKKTHLIEGRKKMKNDKLSKNTKKLQTLVKTRKTSVVVYEHGKLKRTSKTLGSGGSYSGDGYSYYDYE